ncbi:DUF7848 domain-containing protein [Streptomyces sp. NBC_01750]|uniref:DUF7848 domain-containing protein n=1 Tax=Streptomyces sp. NBC_01750 TaxID=2975928 RepID=UPI003FA3750C
MAERTGWRFVNWVLQLDTSGSGPIYETECTTCGESSEAADDKEAPELWCLQHAGRSGHTGFRALTTSFFRATQVESGGAD